METSMSKKGLIEDFKLTLEERGTTLLREYTDQEIQRFLEEDKLDPETLAKVRWLLEKYTPDDFLRELVGPKTLKPSPPDLP
jgi:hypothetical protein